MKKKITSLLLTLSLCIGVLAVPNTAMAAQAENQYLIPNDNVNKSEVIFFFIIHIPRNIAIRSKVY